MEEPSEDQESNVVSLQSVFEHVMSLQKKLDEREVERLLEVDELKEQMTGLKKELDEKTSKKPSYRDFRDMIRMRSGGQMKEQAQRQHDFTKVREEDSFFRRISADGHVDMDEVIEKFHGRKDDLKVQEQQSQQQQQPQQQQQQQDQKNTLGEPDEALSASIEVLSSSIMVPPMTSSSHHRSNGGMNERYVLPEDVFTMFFFADLYSPAFLYGIFVFAFQLLTLVILLIDLVADPNLPEGETDRNLLNIPIHVDWQVHIGRIIAVLVAVISRDDCLDTFWIVTIGFKRRWQDYFHGATVTQFVMMNIMRFTEGACTIVTSFIVVVQADNVRDLFLNFAAIEFISNVDNLAYTLAAAGWMTRSMMELTERIKLTPIYVTEKDRRKLKQKQFIKHVLMGGMLIALYAGLFAIYRIEKSGTLLENISCARVLVTFGEQKFRLSTVSGTDFQGFEITTTEIPEATQDFRALVGSQRPILINATNPPDLLFSHFSGLYEGIYTNDKRVANRPIYYERGFEDPTAGKFYYCSPEKAWVFTIPAFGSNNAVPKPTRDRCGSDGWLLRSAVTDAYALEDVPSDGWKAWTGSLVEVNDFNSRCATCSSDIDCSVVRGTCQLGRCACYPGFEGTFCEADTPCPYVANYRQGKVKILEKANFTANKRPIYMFDLEADDDDDEEEEEEEEEDNRSKKGRKSWRMIVHAGTRWYDTFFDKDDLRVFEAFRIRDNLTDRELRFRFSSWFHPYWAGILNAGTQQISERTEQITPTGSLKWEIFLESRAEGEYGIYGGLKDFVQSFECLSVDCSIEPICGDFGECTAVDSIVVYAGTLDTGIQGNQCVCTVPNVTGHYCEFPNYVRWDENGTITAGPYQMDPFEAGCLGPLKDLPNCREKLYPNTDVQD